MIGLILLLVVIAALSAVFILYGLTGGAAGYLLFFGLVLGAAVVFSIIAGAVALTMPGTKSPDDQRE